MSEQKIDELETYRCQIDVLDRRILDLLNERTAIVEQIGRVKQERKLGVYEPDVYKRQSLMRANDPTGALKTLIGPAHHA